jgi:hypothetical protein
MTTDHEAVGSNPSGEAMDEESREETVQRGEDELQGVSHRLVLIDAAGVDVGAVPARAKVIAGKCEIEALRPLDVQHDVTIARYRVELVDGTVLATGDFDAPVGASIGTEVRASVFLSYD